jgi:hypothetical protein
VSVFTFPYTYEALCFASRPFQLENHTYLLSLWDDNQSKHI